MKLTIRAHPAAIETVCCLCPRTITLPLDARISAMLLAVDNMELSVEGAEAICMECVAGIPTKAR